MSMPGQGATTVMVVDDDTDLLQLIAMRLSAQGYQPICVESAEQALEMLEQVSPGVVITDLKMDGMDGMTLLQQLRQQRPTLPVIMLTAQGTIPDAVMAAQQGVFAFLTKPINKQELFATLEKASALSQATQPENESWADAIITRSAAMFDLLEQAKMVAKSNVSVLILGESGTGKELLAQAIHTASERNHQPFVPINCGAIPSELLESELFGYRKGAFTGANQNFKGLFLTAHQGTLFLDEIGDMPLALQVKLLRVLQEGKVRQLGATEQQDVNLRVIAATHRDLEQAIADGDFREDLYYRLNVVSLEIPPLRHRREDIPLLVNHFLTQHASQHNQPVKHFSTDAMQLVMQYHWPGNIRQLQNMVEKMIALCPGQVISESLVQTGLPRDRLEVTPLTEAKQQFEKNYVKQLLKMTGGNIPEAAALAQRNRSDFYKIMRRHNIDNEQYRINNATELSDD